jgi:hypothetical protein
MYPAAEKPFATVAKEFFQGEIKVGIKLFFRALILFAASALFSGIMAVAAGLGWLVFVAGTLPIFLILVLLYLGVMNFWHLRPLRRWQNIYKDTGLVGFEKKNESSAYMPSQIFERKNVKSLSVMGNGCSKWTRDVPDSKATPKLKQIREKGPIRFLASCPVKLMKDHPNRATKAKSNAESLLKLLDYKEQTRNASYPFEIRTYKHLATLRLIILNDAECIVGHYKEEAEGDSRETPLLIFDCKDDDEWGFGHAFQRLFNSEWNRAKEPTSDEWEFMKRLKDKGV